MRKYLWQAKDAEGREVSRYIVAESAHAAREQLLAEGLRDLSLIRDDIVADIAAKSPSLAHLSAEEAVKIHRLPKMTRGRLAWNVLKDCGFIGVIALAFAARSWQRGRTGMALATVAIFGVFVIYATLLRLNSYLWTRLNEAREWQDIGEVFRLSNWLARIRGLTGKGIAQHQLIKFRTLAFAWQGNLTQALGEFRYYQDKFPPAQYASHVGSIYEAVGKIDESIQQAEQALTLDPKVAVYRSDLAWKLLYHDRDLTRAKALLDEADALVLPELARPFTLRNRGMIALREGRPEEAQRLLKEALEIWLGPAHKFFRATNEALTRAYLCQAEAQLGNRPAALEHFELAKPMLQLKGREHLLRACSEAVMANR